MQTDTTTDTATLQRAHTFAGETLRHAFARDARTSHATMREVAHAYMAVQRAVRESLRR